jgi:hypothetical protein
MFLQTEEKNDFNTPTVYLSHTAKAEKGQINCETVTPDCDSEIPIHDNVNIMPIFGNPVEIRLTKFEISSILFAKTLFQNLLV